MENRNIRILECSKNIENSEENSSILEKIKDINIQDKWIYDKAVRSFVSFIRFYSEHDLKYIFDINLLDLGNLANSFQLLRIPRIKEIVGKKVLNFNQSDINPQSLIYKDKNISMQMDEKAEY